MLPQITELEFEIDDFPEELPTLGKSFLYDFEKGEFVLKNGKPIILEGKNALKMWIEKTIRTERNRFEVYANKEYGVSLEDLIGSNFPNDFIESEIKREIVSSLELHPHITAVENWDFERDGKWMKISFTVNTPEGAFEQEVEL